VDECKPLGGGGDGGGGDGGGGAPTLIARKDTPVFYSQSVDGPLGRGLHSSTFRLNVSTL